MIEHGTVVTVSSKENELRKILLNRHIIMLYRHTKPKLMNNGTSASCSLLGMRLTKRSSNHRVMTEAAKKAGFNSRLSSRDFDPFGTTTTSICRPSRAEFN
jgi:hypothetical protein